METQSNLYACLFPQHLILAMMANIISNCAFQRLTFRMIADPSPAVNGIFHLSLPSTPAPGKPTLSTVIGQSQTLRFDWLESLAAFRSTKTDVSQLSKGGILYERRVPTSNVLYRLRRLQHRMELVLVNDGTLGVGDACTNGWMRTDGNC